MRRAALVLLAVSVLTACSAGPSLRPVIAVKGEENQPVDQSTLAGPQPVPPLQDYRADSLAWSPCGEQMRDRIGTNVPEGDQKYECARMTTVLDAPGRPGRGSLSIALTRVGTGKNALVVVSDPGGEPGTVKAARIAAAMPKDLLSTYTVIGMDRRGTGRSEGMACVPAGTRAALVEYDPAETEQSSLVVAAGEASQECVLDLEGRLTAFDSWRAAADLERLRDHLGTDRLNVIGVGEGSRVVATYAQRYPNRIGRTVLDGAHDPTLDQTGVLESRAAAAEATFEAFARDCQARGCGLAKPRDEVTALLAQLRTSRINGEYVDLTAGSALNAILSGLQDRPRWPALADAIVKARAGDGSALFTFLNPLVGDSDENPPRFDAGLVISCNDTTTRIPPDRVKALTTDWQGKHPLFGTLFARQLLHCSPFPVPTLTKVDPVKSAPPIVLLSTADDPATPASGTEHAAQRLPGSVLIGWQGSGHGALGLSGCATTAVRDYLVDAKVPTNGTVCPP
ncbi:alpha/beta hydrolase [Nocardia sp. NRRL S-836]|uniref:alpha/beta hydrolase n=1 Tax=Nocardia sp. NRRL S-836 TaxID=1519492 RepID=UPI0006B06C08|nr:alpha/beta hydrolase [Nocardia sp. NRRL S-836]